MISPSSLWLCTLLVVATGCGAPTYKNDGSEPLAKIDLTGRKASWICVAGKQWRLQADASGHAEIPASGRLDFSTLYSVRNGRCMPDAAASFVPEAGQRYVMDIQAKEERCFITVMKLDPSAPNGVVLEASARHSSESCERKRKR